MKDLIYRETARRIIDSPRTHKQMLDVLASVNAVEVIPTSKVEDAIAEMQHLHDLYKFNFQGHSMSVAKDCIDIIRKHTGIGE